MTLRYSLRQEHAGSARRRRAPPGRSGRRTSSRCRTASLFNTNPHAQAYENAFGILYDDLNVVSGYPGGVVGEYETRVAHATNGLYLDLDRQTFDAQWDITDKLRVPRDRRAPRAGHAASWWTSTPIRACSSPTARTTTRSSRIRTSCNCCGTHGDREQFNWVIGYYANERSAKSRVPTFSAAYRSLVRPAGQRRHDPRRDRSPTAPSASTTECAALNRAEPVRRHAADDGRADPGARGAGIAGHRRSNPQLPRRDAGRILERAWPGPNFDSLNITLRRDRSRIRGLELGHHGEAHRSAVGVRPQDGHAPRHGPGPPRASVLRPRPTSGAVPVERLQTTTCATRSAIRRSTPARGRVRIRRTRRRALSVQYQFTDDLMAYVTLVERLRSPAARRSVPANILVLNAAGVGDGRAAARRLQHQPALRSICLTSSCAASRPSTTTRSASRPTGSTAGSARTSRRSMTDWENMTGSTYVATVWWDLDGNGFAEVRAYRAPRAAMRTNTYEVNYFPNLLTVGRARRPKSSGIEIEATWGGGENYQLGFNTRIARHGVRRARPSRRRHGAGLQRGRQVRGRARHDGQPLGPIRLVAQRTARSLSARLDYTWTDDYTGFAGGPLQRTQEAYGLLNARLVYDPGIELVARSGRHQPHRGVLQPGVLLHGVATDVGWQRRPAARGLLRPQLRRSIDRVACRPSPARGPVSFALDSPD